MAFDNYDPTKPNEKYFQHVDKVVAEANKLGIYIALLPTWGDKFNKKWDPGPEMLHPKTRKFMVSYISKRYQNKRA
jgi:hypothetical protein